MIEGSAKLRVWNRTKYGIGVNLLSGISVNIEPGSFYPMSADDIVRIESSYRKSAFFGTKQLVPTDDAGREISLDDLGIPVDKKRVYRNDDEITAALKGPVKKMEAWVADIDDPAELHAIYEVAKEIDLPLQKVKILKKYIPNKDWLDDLG